MSEKSENRNVREPKVTDDFLFLNDIKPTNSIYKKNNKEEQEILTLRKLSTDNIWHFCIHKTTND